MFRPRFLAAALTLTVTAALASGIRPRPDARDYPAQEQSPQATLAAAALSSSQVRGAFGSDLSKAYVVLEVAVYPGANGNLQISPDDFMLRIGSATDLIRPAQPATIARAIQEKNEPKRSRSRGETDVYSGAEIGHESGGYDPVTGRRRSGWYSAAQTGVSSGPANPGAPPPGTWNDGDRTRLEADLLDKALPEGAATQPVAGYLYFPLPAKNKKDAAFELRYLGQSANLRLAVPAAGR